MKKNTGEHETASYDKFSHGVVVVHLLELDNKKNGKGYFEDRRPSSNCDPYLVTAKMFETTCF